MGAATMRVVLCIAFLVFAVACVSETQAISFDELVSRAEEAQHPKPVKAPPPPDPDMEEWSTDHLLGLDQPPPTDMFDDLVKRSTHKKPVAHKKAHVVHHVKHKAHKKLLKHKKHKKMLKKKLLKKKKMLKRKQHNEERRARAAFAENLITSLPHVDHEKTGHAVSANLGSLMPHRKKVHHKKVHKKVRHASHKKMKKHAKKAQMVQTHKVHHKKAHKKVHKKAHKKKKVHHEEHFSGLGHLTAPADDDDQVPEDEEASFLTEGAEDDEEAPQSLSGLAGSMLQEDDDRDKAKRAAKHAKHLAAK